MLLLPKKEPPQQRSVMPTSDREMLEQLIDRIGLRGVFQLIWEICRKKAEANPRANNYPFETLEYLIDEIALNSVLHTIAEVCWAKSEHIRGQRLRIEDDTTPKHKWYEELENRWARMAERFEKLADRTSLGGGEIELRTP
jgi:hypothetical protein